MKKTLSLILAVIMIVSLLPLSFAFAATLGDVTGDDKINSRDIATLQRYIAGSAEFTPEQLAAGDVNSDGKVNSRDIAAVQKHVVGILPLAPATQAPATEDPTVAPTTEAPATEDPTVAPTTEAPTDAPATESPVVSGPTPPPALSTNLTSNSSTFTVKEIADAASTIVSHYETYKDMETEYSIAKALPVGSYVISEQDWAYMAGYAINGLSGAYAASGLSGYTAETKITYKNMGKPSVDAVDQYGGDELTLAEVAEAAWKALSNYGNNNGRVAASCGSMETINKKQISYYSIIMATARALEYYATNGSLPATVLFDCLNYTTEDSDSYVEAPEATQAPETSSPSGNLTVSEIVDAFAAEYAKFEETDKLPETLTIGSAVGMNQATYFGVAARAIMAINKGNTTSTIPVKNYKNAEYGNRFDKFDSETVSLTGILYMADKQVTYSDNNGRAANYITFPGSSGTSYSGPANADRCAVIMMRVLSEYKKTGSLPTETSSWGSDYTTATMNCESDDPTIIALANEITSGKSTTAEKAKAIFEWVQDNIEYEYYANTRRSAMVVLNDRQANCCDHGHIVNALARAVGIPARYVHGDCKFGNSTEGHIWSELFVDGEWVTCDASMDVNTYGNHERWTWVTHHANYIELYF